MVAVSLQRLFPALFVARAAGASLLLTARADISDNQCSGDIVSGLPEPRVGNIVWDDCAAIVTAAASLKATGAAYYWLLPPYTKGLHLARYRTCQLSVDTVSNSAQTYFGANDIATNINGSRADVKENGQSQGGKELCAIGSPCGTDVSWCKQSEQETQWFTLDWDGSEADVTFYDSIGQGDATHCPDGTCPDAE